MNNAPLATYRLQINPEFPFEQAERIAPYLAKLGVSHLYTSPVFAAARGSAHGYDVVDMNALNEEVGGEKGFQSLSAALSRLGMKIIQDIVPNHRAFSGENSLLMDVLENGPA